jgi:hypothetical protein
MTSLRNFLEKDIEDTALDLKERYTYGAIDLHEYGVTLSRLIFRSQSSNYWALDGRGMNWYCFSRGSWEQVLDVPMRLEGPADLPIFHDSSVEKKKKMNVIDLHPEVKGSKADHQIYSEFVELVCSGFKDGSLTSDEAEAFLYSHFLIANNGNPWAVGVRTRRWYYFEKGKWRESKNPPQDSQLTKWPNAINYCPKCGKETTGESKCPHCGEQLSPSFALKNKEAWVALSDFLVNSFGELPEQLTDPWNPPAWYPDAIHQDGIICSLCQASNPVDSRFCNSCGNPLLLEQGEISSRQKEKTKQAKKTIICPNCGAVLASGRKYCTQCGKSLIG